MKQKEIETLLEDKLNQIMVAIRASHPSAQDIKDLSIKLDNHITTHEKDAIEIKQDMAELKKSVKPAVAAVDTANGLRKGVIWIAGFIIATGSIWVALGHFKQWIKQ